MTVSKRAVRKSLSKRLLVGWAYAVELPSSTTLSMQELIDTLAIKRSLEVAMPRQQPSEGVR